MSGAQRGYDPLAAPSIMDQMRSATPETKQPGRLWFIGHLPIARQYQILGVLLLLFGVLAGLMLWLNYRANSQAGASSATATEMQMLRSGWRAGTCARAQGMPPRSKASGIHVTVSALTWMPDQGRRTSGRHCRRPPSTKREKVWAARYPLQAGPKERDRRDRITRRPWSPVQGLDNNQPGQTMRCSSLAQQASAQVASAGGSLREVDFTSQPAMLSQRIAKNAEFTGFV